MIFPSIEVNMAYLVLSSECHIYLILLFCLCTSHVCGVSDSLMYVGVPYVCM